MNRIEGIVLRRIPYLSKGVILDILTPTEKIAVILPGKNRGLAAETQPGNLVSLVVGHPRGSALPPVRELVADTAAADISRLSPYRSAQLLFICELTAHTTREQESGSPLYELLYQTIRSLCHQGERFLCLRYTYQLARLLGFAPGYPEGADRKYFDLRSGVFVAEKPLHNYYLTPAHAAPFFALGDPEKSPDFTHEKDYLNLWHILMTYFSLHIEGFQRPRSLEFLQQLTRIEYFPPKE